MKVFLLLTLIALSAQAVEGAGLDYDRQVRPILSDKCFQCHGFDVRVAFDNVTVWALK
jgi:hypothetical protein